jgi:hypothetical protein
VRLHDERLPCAWKHAVVSALAFTAAVAPSPAQAQRFRTRPAARGRRSGSLPTRRRLA